MPELLRTAASPASATPSPAVRDLFMQVHKVPSVPRLVQELIQQFGSKSSQVDEISQKIQLDPVLSLKVLRLANSAHFGAGRKVGSIDYAVVLLGFDTLKILVIASGVISACDSIPGMDRERFWRRAFTVASIAKLIARQARKDPETAFTCGMLHNIGDALMYVAHIDDMQAIDQQTDTGTIRSQLQRETFGYDYAQVGAELTTHWKFPQTIATAIRYHEDPDSAGADADYARIVNLAVEIYQQIQADPNNADSLLAISVAKLRALGVDPKIFTEKLALMLEQVGDVQDLLS